MFKPSLEHSCVSNQPKFYANLLKGLRVMIRYTNKKEQKPNRHFLIEWVDFGTKLMALVIYLSPTVLRTSKKKKEKKNFIFFIEIKD